MNAVCLWSSPAGGGPSTPELCAAVSEAGGPGFLAAGYLDAGELAARIDPHMPHSGTRLRGPNADPDRGAQVTIRFCTKAVWTILPQPLR